jgi:hypothetical protein
MLRSAEGLKRNAVIAEDGRIGLVHDSLFDDERWTIRYLVVDTQWIGGRRVLISPMAVDAADGVAKEIRVSLTMDQVERSPDIDTDAPVYRQQERKYADHYRWPYYWGWGGLWGAYGAPSALMAGGRAERPEDQRGDADEGDPHLRSVREITGYHVEAADGDIGHVEDLLFDEQSWAVRYLVVDTSNWWFGKKVLLSPEWATAFRWADRKAVVELTREQIQRAPEWHESELINREYEERLYDAYGRPGYWEADRRRDRDPPGPHALL